MKIVLVSDTHGLHSKMRHPVPDGDVLVHAGDFTNVGSPDDCAQFDKWLGSLPHPHKIVIAGNHERGWDRMSLDFKHFTNAHYLEDSSINIAGVNFYGSPWTPTFGTGWAFNADRGNHIRGKWGMIPDAGLVDVLITHGPPMGILDKSAPIYGSQSVGCEDLAKQVTISVPKIHVFGHIHNGYGQKRIGQTLYVNAAICDEDYRPVNAPIVVEI